jgi:hypothetical protein
MPHNSGRRQQIAEERWLVWFGLVKHQEEAAGSVKEKTKARAAGAGESQEMVDSGL